MTTMSNGDRKSFDLSTAEGFKAYHDTLPVKSPDEFLVEVLQTYQGWTQDPAHRAFLLRAIRATDVPSHFAYDAASEFVRKLPMREHRNFASAELYAETPRQLLMRYIVMSFLFLMALAVFALFFIAIVQASDKGGGGGEGGQSAQMLLTVFTTVFAFLSGRFMPTMWGAIQRKLRGNRRNSQETSNHNTNSQTKSSTSPHRKR